MHYSFKLTVVLVVIMASGNGCAPLKPANGPPSESSAWRKPDGQVRPTGIDPRAREIERSLGVE